MLGSNPPHLQLRAFIQRLRELGYVEGSNLVIDRRSAEGKFERLPEIVREEVAQKVDVIVSPTDVVTQAAKSVTTSVPIVMVGNALPVELGFVQSLARPGGNITGLTFEVSIDYVGKRLELTKEFFPKMSRMAVLTSSESVALLRRHLVDTCTRLGISLLWAEHSSTDFTEAFHLLRNERPDVVYVTATAAAFAHRHKIVQFVNDNRLPATFPSRDYAAAGGLVSFGVNLQDLGRRAADYVNRILKGERAADLPVQRPERYELVLNLATARMLGITIPPAVLARADDVIK